MSNAGAIVIIAFLSSVNAAAFAQAPDSSLLNREDIESRQEATESRLQRHAKAMGTIRRQHQQLHDNRLEISRQETEFLLSLVDRLERLEKRLDEIDEKTRPPVPPHN